MTDTVLVTGVSGFIASHVAAGLLQQGYAVRGTVRNKVKQPGRGAHMLVKEDDWSDPDWRPLTAYPVSKTRAERAVWDYAKSQNVTDRITTINPGLVFGPDTYDNGGASLAIIKGASFQGPRKMRYSPPQRA